MALPTVEKTWRYNANISQLTASNLVWHQQLMWKIKEALCTDNQSNWDTVPTGLWTVNHSCGYSDDLGTADDGVDRWSSSGDIWWDYNDAAAWFVFDTPHNGGTGQYLIDCNNRSSTGANAYPESIYARYAREGGFSGGTIDAPPTATTTTLLTRPYSSTYYNWAGGYSADGPDVKVHVLMSDDGKEMRIFIMRSNVCVAFWALGELADPPATNTSDGLDFWGVVWGGSTSNSTIDGLHTQSAGWLQGGTSRASCSSSYAQPMYLSASHATDYWNPWENSFIGGIGDEIDNTCPFGNIYLWDTDTAGERGPKGRIKDMWIVPDNWATGTSFPLDGSRQFVKIGKNIVVPWNGTIIETA